jgi:mannose-6-phosphate isomerase
MAGCEVKIDNILGVSFTVKADRDVVYLKRLVDLYAKKVEDAGGGEEIGDSLAIMKIRLKKAIMAGILICDELEQERAAEKEYTVDFTRRFENISQKLDEMLKENTDTKAVVSGDSVDLARGVLRLENAVRHYDWGSTEWLPELLGKENLDKTPWAELWMGTAAGGESKALLGDTAMPLSAMFKGAENYYLGKETASRYRSLPYLFKVLAVEKPLSIQVHPNKAQAEAGFAAEEKAGIPLDSTLRNYKDRNQKVEMVCALGPFTALCGFRPLAETARLLDALGCVAVKDVLKTLYNNPGNGRRSYQAFLTSIFALTDFQKRELSDFLRKHIKSLIDSASQWKREWEICSQLSNYFPGDSSCLAPLYLNILQLAPSEAVFIPPGTPHSYLQGMAVEIMSTSDNVVRGGLTTKHIDTAALLAILRPETYMPEVLHSEPNDEGFSAFHTDAPEFTLAVITCAGEKKTRLAVPGPLIVLVTEGIMRLRGGDRAELFKKGESLFVADGLNRQSFELDGNFTAWVASVNKVKGAG